MGTIAAGDWLIAVVTLFGAILGSALAAWFLAKTAGREFREAVIKEVAEMKVKQGDIEHRFQDHLKEAADRDKELIELGKISARLEAIVSILARDMVIIKDPMSSKPIAIKHE